MTKPRLPYLADDQVGPPELVAAIRQRRGGELLELDRILLHSPPVAEGWNAMFGRLRTQTTLDSRWRELAMCAVAALNGAEYELFHHAPLFRAAGGTAAQAFALRRLADDDADAALLDPAWDDDSRAVLHLVAQSTRRVHIDEPTFAAARRVVGSDRHLFELVAVTAGYNMVSRVLVAFGIEPD